MKIYTLPYELTSKIGSPSQARIEIYEEQYHYCNMCWTDKGEDKSESAIAVYSPIGQNIFTLSLCNKHRFLLGRACLYYPELDTLGNLEE